MATSWRMCVAVDVEGYRRRGLDGQRRAQADLVELLDGAWHGMSGAERQPTGDGEVAVAAADVDHSAVLSHILNGLHAGLAAQTSPDGRLRLRVAAHVGHVEHGANGFLGHAVVRTCRMVDSAQLRAALADHPAADLALMVSDPVIEDVIGRELHQLRAVDFRPVDVSEPTKGFAARAWLHIPDVSAPSAEVTEQPRFRVDVAAGGHVGAVVQIGELHGPLVLGLPAAPGIPSR